MSEERLITVAIHTYEKAIMLKTLLESEGIDVALQNVNLLQPVVSSGVRVRIKERDLPLALRIIENAEIFTSPIEQRTAKKVASALVPTDFSDYSSRAASIGFEIAHKLKADVVFLHSYIDPFRTGNLQLTDAFSYDSIDDEEQARVESEVNGLMHDFTNKVRDKIKNGDIPPVKFSSIIAEGVPEETIIEYTRTNPTSIIVMGTRGRGKKEKEMIGSVTAEVLDSCRIPAFTVPESTTLMSVKSIKDIIFFSNLEQEDILALDTFYRLFPAATFNVTIVHIPGKKERNNTHDKAITSLLTYCREHYKQYTFEVKEVKLQSIVDDFNAISAQQPINLIVVPNKKKNIFARLFNPSLAHKLLFHADIPMMVIPV